MLFALFSSAFTALVILSAIFSSKLVPITDTLVLPAGLLVTPLTIALSALVTEIYGATIARKMVLFSLGICCFCTLLIKVALDLPAYDALHEEAFHLVLGLNAVIVVSSLVGYLASQMSEIYILSTLKAKFGNNQLWLRVFVATLLSQMIDSSIVNVGYLGLGLGMENSEVLKIIAISTAYKVIAGFGMTPLVYLGVSSKNSLKNSWQIG